MVASPALETKDMAGENAKVRRILRSLPKDRPITRAEAERILVRLYRAGESSVRIGALMGCSGDYVLKVVQRKAPELIRSGAPSKGKRAPRPQPVYDLRAARAVWRATEYEARRAEQDARMTKAYNAGASLRDIARRECLGLDAVAKRIADAEARSAASRRGTARR